MIQANHTTYEKVATQEIGDSRLAFGIIMSMAAMVGVWSTTCIISGMASAGSFGELGRGLITAVIGI